MNYLGKRGAVLANLKPDQDGLISLDISPLEGYNQLVLVVEDSRGNVVIQVPSPRSKPTTVDTTLKASKTANKVYQYERNARLVAQGATETIADLNSTELSIVEDLPTVFSLLKLIDSGLSSKLEEWKFLVSWGSLEPK